MEVIVPAAGQSSRFPNMKPKYLLFDYKHDMMLKNAVRPFLHNDKVTRITVGILKEHDITYNASLYIRNEIPEVNIVVLDNPTSGPADTVYQIIQHMNMDMKEGLFIKDCDSFFDHDIGKDDYVCVSKISDHETLRRLSSKSFVKTNDQTIITDIVEKSVISDTFCVGGYSFFTIADYVRAYENIKSTKQEIFVSHVIQEAMALGSVFVTDVVTNYVDVGTADDWFRFNDKPVVFCDVDGTIIKAQGRCGENSYNDPPILLEENVKKIKELENNGSQIGFITSRPVSEHETTINMLKNIGFINFFLISGLHNSHRIIINDYNEANPFPRATAINVRRDSDNLKDFL